MVLKSPRLHCVFSRQLDHQECIHTVTYPSGSVFSYKLRYIVGFGLVEIAISTNPKPTIYRNLYENTGPGYDN